ncbi:MAG: hypothetical protein HGB18_03800, partial [Candidatus Moranbacteria bacterium]|nr:hypothetical protein [Candidatus Moranbacteria bacterium]
MTEYVTQKIRNIFILVLAGILGVGTIIRWQGEPRPVLAQSLDQISISLSLFDDRNETVSGTLPVRFAIYSQDRSDITASDASGRLWEETKEVDVRGGIVRTSLGETVPLPRDLFSDMTRDYFLGIRVGNDSEMIPRKRIASVPSAFNASNAASLGGKIVGTKSGNIPTIGKGGKLDIALLPTGTGTKQLVLGNDGRLHDQNTDSGTDSDSFVIGNGTGLGVANFDLSVSSSAAKPTLRYDSVAGVWQLSNDGAAFSQILTGASGSFLSLSGGTMTGTISFDAAQTFGGATLSELSYLSGVTGNIQTQLSGKAALSHTHAASDIVSGTIAVARGGTGLSSYAFGDILFAADSTTLSTLGIGVDGECLVVNGGVPVWGACSGLGGSSHGLLSATHTDTTTGTVQRGDLITGQGSTAKWTRLALGSVGRVLQSNGTDAAWAQLSGSDVGLGNVENTALSTWGGSANIVTVGTVASGTWHGGLIGASYGGTGLSSAGTAGNLLRSDGTGWTSWTPTYLTGNQTVTLSGDVSGSGATSITTTIGSGTVTSTKIADDTIK